NQQRFRLRPRGAAKGCHGKQYRSKTVQLYPPLGCDRPGGPSHLQRESVAHGPAGSKGYLCRSPSKSALPARGTGQDAVKAECPAELVHPVPESDMAAGLAAEVQASFCLSMCACSPASSCCRK